MSTQDHPIVNTNNTVRVVNGFLGNAKNVVDYVKKVKPKAFLVLEVTYFHNHESIIQNQYDP